jgi:aryl-alcohol dehydrogenase-like predicted oxidoreductase
MPMNEGATKRLWRPFFQLGGEVEIHRLGFGAMRVVGNAQIYGAPADRAAALAVLRHASEAGVSFIDTADAYGPGTSEELIAEALHPYRSGLVIATKGGVERPTAEAWKPNGRPAHLRQACEASLKRLRVDCIDLYQLHCVDPEVALEDSMGTLFDLQREGKIRHVGVSNFDILELERAMKLGAIVSVQNRYGVLRRQDEPMLRFCEKHRIAYIPWGPLAEGRSADNAVLVGVAARHGATPTQVAIAWLLSHSPVLVPIPGTSSLAHLEENLAAREFILTTDDMHDLDAAGTPR